MKEGVPKITETSSKCVLMLCSSDEVLNQILSEVREIKTCMSSRLTSLELNVSILVKTCSKISNKIEILSKENADDNRDSDKLNKYSTAKKIKEEQFCTKENVIAHSCLQREDLKQSAVCCAEGNPSPKIESALDKDANLGKLKLIPVSFEADYPNGSWLGDPDSPSCRVRCPIPKEKLLHINATCSSPEKMALFLLDSIFTKEELSVSNISGRSRFGKKQLNPLFIFGIKCHLQHKFFITEKDWHRICQNMDAKCRFAWKRKMSIKNTKSKIKICTYTNKEKTSSLTTSEDMNFDYDNLNHTSIDFNSCVKVISQNPCELRIVNATPDQIAHLQGSRGIILTQEMIPESSEEKEEILMSNQSDLSMDTVVMNGEADLGSDLTISPNGDTTLEVSMEEDALDSGGSNEKTSTACQIHTMSLKDLQLNVDHSNMLERDSEADE